MCPSKEVLLAWIEGTISDAGTENAIESHVVLCDECANFVAEYYKMDEAETVTDAEELLEDTALYIMMVEATCPPPAVQCLPLGR